MSNQNPATFILSLANARELIVVEYPAIVNNHHKALATLGGMDAIHRVFNSNGRKSLALTFRPNVLSAKPAHATRRDVFIVFIQVQQLRHKVTGDIRMGIELIGLSRSLYSFEGMFDFQYCPMLTLPSSNSTDISASHGSSSSPNKIGWNEKDGLSYEKVDLLREDIFDVSLTDFFEEHKDDPIYLLPRFFTRMDQGCTLNLGDVSHGNADGQSSIITDIATDDNKAGSDGKRRIVGKVRRKPRARFAFLCRYDSPIPQEPHPSALQRLTEWVFLKPVYTALKEAFEECPIMTKRSMAAFIANLKCDSLRYYKECIPMVAYYLHNGPWKRTWVRLGFDPKQPKNAHIARLYQVVEVKIMTHGYDDMHLRILNRSIPLPSKQSVVNKGQYLFQTHELPYAFDSFYRLTDIQHEPVQQLIASCPIATECHVEYGWFREGFIHEVRRLLRLDIQATVAATFRQHSTLADQDVEMEEPESEESPSVPERSLRDSLRPRAGGNTLLPEDSVSISGDVDKILGDRPDAFDESELYDSDEDPEYEPSSDSSVEYKKESL